jgi:hypothetical protein
LPDNIRSNFESSTGYDVSGVTMHNDAQSHQMNRSVGARAFAVGSDIYMGESAPSLDSKEGQEVAYHELTHTIQQGAVAPKVQTDRDEKA